MLSKRFLKNSLSFWGFALTFCKTEKTGEKYFAVISFIIFINSKSNLLEKNCDYKEAT
jgi:hypothetical protein